MISNVGFTDVRAMRDIEGYSRQAMIFTRLRERKISERKPVWSVK